MMCWPSACFSACLLFVSTSEGAINIANFNLNSDSISFNISGTFPINVSSTFPNLITTVYLESLFFLNSEFPNHTDSRLVLKETSSSSVSDFTGAQSLSTTYSVYTGTFDEGDFFGVRFHYPFSPHESINGTLSAVWDDPVFDPSKVTTFNVFWANIGDGAEIINGTYIGSVVVPEPSSLSLLLTGGAVLMVGRRKKPERRVRLI